MQTELTRLETNISRLLAAYASLQQAYATLQQAHALQCDELVRAHAELQQLRQLTMRQQTALGMLGDHEAHERAKQQLSYIISEIDLALGALKQ